MSDDRRDRIAPLLESEDVVPRGVGGRDLSAFIASRRSSSPKALAGPGPSDTEIDAMIRAAVAAPDHGRLRPWRFLHIADAGRDALGELFVEAKVRQSPDCTAADLERERDRAARAPGLIAVVSRPDPDHSHVPVSEQLISVGAAIQNILLVAHACGYGARMVSGTKTRDRILCTALGLTDEEDLIGFICIGHSTRTPKTPPRADLADVLTRWQGLDDD